MTIRKATLGTISHGTMRAEDLIHSFSNELGYLAAVENYELLTAVNTFTANETADYDSEEASDLVTALFDALDALAPPYCYFGATEGDGSDYGFWPSMEAIEDLPRVADPGDVEAMGEDCAFVNDHGNVTVYGADGAVLIDFV